MAMKMFIVIMLFIGCLGWYSVAFGESNKHYYPGNVDDICYMPTSGTMEELCSRR